MHYDFDQYIDRTHTSSVKWDMLESRFGVQDVIPMWIADMDFKSPQPVIDALKQRAEHGIYGYTLRPDSYAQAIIDWYTRRHHFTLEPKWLCHSPGVVAGLSTIVNTFTEPGDKIIIQPPVYYPFKNVIQQHGREIIVNPLIFADGQYTMNYADLEEKAASGAKLLVLCNPHNPVGRVWSREELEQLGRICLKYHVLVVADEIHGDLVYTGHVYTPFASINREFAQHSLTCIAASKTFNLAGLQTSTIIIPDSQLRKRYLKMVGRLVLGGSNVFGLVATEAAYRYGDEWLDQLLAYLEGNIDFLITYFAEHIPQINVLRPEGTYLVWLDCRALGMDRKSLDQFFLHQARVAFDEGHIFGPQGEGFSRINVACPRPLLEQVCKNIEQAVTKYIASTISRQDERSSINRENSGNS